MDKPSAKPGLFAVRAQDLPLSGPALLDLMWAVLSKGIPFRFCARGWSMAPFILDGDVITVVPLGHCLPGLGEVVAFVRPLDGHLVVHRVVARRTGAVLIQGDNVAGCTDGYIPSENLLGKVKRIERRGRSIWLGMGPERYLIAWLSRSLLLISLQNLIAARNKLFSRW